MTMRRERLNQYLLTPSSLAKWFLQESTKDFHQGAMILRSCLNTEVVMKAGIVMDPEEALILIKAMFFRVTSS